MELQFSKKLCTCLDMALREVQNMEQSLEIRLPDGMPDIGQVLCAWGQPVLRGKEWRDDSVTASAGMMVKVLYTSAEDGTTQCVEGWIPFQFVWELPGDTPEGSIRVRLLTRFADARGVSARKLTVRAGLAALAEGWYSSRKELYSPDRVPEDVQMRITRYPVRLPMEAGEKAFALEERLTLPASAPAVGRVLFADLDAMVTDRKILSDKALFRGCGKLHILYESEAGQLHGWDFELPFSQFAELSGTFSADAEADVLCQVTVLELEQEEEGLHLKCALTAQYLATDTVMTELVEDAYSLLRPAEPLIQELELLALLESRREQEKLSREITMDLNLLVDARVLPDFPGVEQSDQGVQIKLPATVQLLGYGPEGNLTAACHRMEGRLRLPADAGSRVDALPPEPGEPQVMLGSGTASIQVPFTLQTVTRGGRGLSMVTGLKLGEPGKPDPARPSLILRRSDERGLWETAKCCGSTVEAIRAANGLAGEPVPGQMLLIPVI